MSNDELIEKTKLELSAAAGLPLVKVDPVGTDKAEQLLKARKTVARAMGIFSFKPVRTLQPRGPWVRRVFTEGPPVKTTIAKDAAKSDLRREVDRLMQEYEAKRRQQIREIAALLSK